MADPSSIHEKILESLQRIDTGTREFEFTVADFERVTKLIYKKAGISLSTSKQDMVYSRLARRLRTKGFKRFSDYLDDLENGHDVGEWEAFVNALTTNLTSFFREAHHFDILADHLRKLGDRRVIKIWCSAASTGEEAYSLAITACEVFGSATPPVQIIASDLDTNVLAHGQSGVYGRDRVEHLDAERVRQFFIPLVDGRVSVRRELQRLVTFRRINLLESGWGLQGPLDAIFCRNVMIYFDKPTQYRILERFVPLLRPEGLLFAGHSESFLHAAKLVKSIGRTVYVRANTDERPGAAT
ncbi:MAG TPA: CheR family methyltransferase [Rhodocyclaceae bacterium]|nr:CheR family methyltransferase [Rhodocyclaceae bacterium]